MSKKDLSFQDKIEATNQLLNDWAALWPTRVVKENKYQKMGDGKNAVGYDPQFVFDAITAIFGDDWSGRVEDTQIIKNEEGKITEVYVLYHISIQSGGKGCYREQFGVRPVKYNNKGEISGTIGDYLKGAVTDAIQKCFVTMSVGNLAYRGVLGDLYYAGKLGDLASEDFDNGKKKATRRTRKSKDKDAGNGSENTGDTNGVKETKSDCPKDNSPTDMGETGKEKSKGNSGVETKEKDNTKSEAKSPDEIVTKDGETLVPYEDREPLNLTDKQIGSCIKEIRKNLWERSKQDADKCREAIENIIGVQDLAELWDKDHHIIKEAVEFSRQAKF